MESINLLEKIEKIPVSDKYINTSYSKTLHLLHSKNTQDCFIEAAFLAEDALLGLFNKVNVPDKLFDAYEAAFSNSKSSLFEHYSEVLEKGDRASLGFINNLKGKLFEFELPDKLKEVYPSHDFIIADNPIQPIWDIQAINEDGIEDFVVQAKMWAGESWSKLVDIMESNEDVMYAASNEIMEKILENSPELAKQFIPIDISNYEFTEDLKENLNTLVNNLGIDMPDELGDLLPYVSEIVLGVRLIMDLISVQRDFKNISTTDKTKLSAVKVIILMSRYGVTTACTSICGLAGSAIGGPIGMAGGTIGGALLSSKVNKEIKPYMLELALELVNLNEDDLFYFNNKNKIDKLALSYVETVA